MKKYGLWLVGVLTMSSCQREKVAPHQDVGALYQRFHGKYLVISSTSSEAVDIDFDGRASSYLLEELPELAVANLEILVDRNPKPDPDGRFMFRQFWPEQSLTAKGGYDATPLNYDPSVAVSYLLQTATRYCEFDPTLKSIAVRVNPKSVVDPLRWPPPESVTLESGDDIRVVNRRRLYTTEGWKTVEIITLYRRYTMNS